MSVFYDWYVNPGSSEEAEGKLLNICTRYAPIYVPAPGHYGAAL